MHVVTKGRALITAPKCNVPGARFFDRNESESDYISIESFLCSYFSIVPPKTKHTVLVVDDDASLLRAMRRLLHALGYEVLVFRSAEAFLAQDAPPAEACLLLDIFLPGMSGIELWATLAASGRSLPTVLMTARDDESTRRLVSEVDVTAILYKPFDEDVLREAIARALANA